MNDYKNHPEHNGEPVVFPGVYIKLDFISCDEEKQLLKALDDIPWDLSQSGRRKQNFGPKCNFKKRKLRVGEFNGFPKSTAFIQERFNEIKLLENYETIEQCSLEYNEERGASIDPHIDDCWIWGERIVTVNLLSDSVLSMIPYNGDLNKYNLNYAPDIYKTVFKSGIFSNEYIIRIPMPARSLLVLFGEARYNWLHLIPRNDINGRRVCLAYREFTGPYLKGGSLEKESDDIREKAKLFW
ncbi:alpha-ketoglutarate-dependent dioxygenase alkB homolog 4 isoform X2 [Lycorma delicatula]